MKDRRKASFTNIHESFSDMALLMLATQALQAAAGYLAQLQ